MSNLWGKSYTRAELLRRVGDMRQIASVEPFELSDGDARGVRAVQIRNAVGLELTVLNERGMAITDLTFHGVPLQFTASVYPAHPAYSDYPGLNWLHTWPGGFLTPCGLTQVGSPVNDNGQELGLHGRLLNTPARNVSWGAEWQGEEFVLWVEGSLFETTIFGENILLRRRIHTLLDQPRLWVEDRVENRGFAATPHMFLQHFNLGFPLVDSTTRLELPAHTTRARDANAKPGLDTCLSYQEPTPGYQEQVFYHDLTPEADGSVSVRLNNPAFAGGRGLAVTWRYKKDEYPILTQWKMMGEGMYVTGVEPGNCHVQGRVWERENGTLPMLQPGETRQYTIELGFEMG